MRKGLDVHCAQGAHCFVMKLAEWMELKNLKDADVSRLLGGKLSRSQVHRIRTGFSNPTIENARELEALTSIPAASFVMGEAGTKRADAQASAA